ARWPACTTEKCTGSEMNGLGGRRRGLIPSGSPWHSGQRRAETSEKWQTALLLPPALQLIRPQNSRTKHRTSELRTIARPPRLYSSCRCSLLCSHLVPSSFTPQTAHRTL